MYMPSVTRRQQQVIDCRDYGAIPGASSASAINAALAAATTGSRRVWIGNGTYLLSADIDVPAGVVFEGESRDGVILKRSSTDATRLLDVLEGGFVRSMTIDGAYDTLGNIASSSEVRLYARAVGEDIRVRNLSYIAVGLMADDAVIRHSELIGNAIGDSGVQAGDGYFGVWADAAGTDSVRVHDCLIRDFHGNGIYIGTNVRYPRVTDCTLRNNHLMGTIVEGGQIDLLSTGGLVSGNTLDGTGAGLRNYGVEVESGGGIVLITGNQIVGHGGSGIYVHTGSASVTITGNQITGNGHGTISGPGITIRPNMTRVQIVGNQITGNGGTGTGTNGSGIYVYSGTSDHLIIVANDLNDNDDGAIQDFSSGTNKRIVGNLPETVTDV